jgi:transcriptional regulator with XRE-family HTH domain
LLRELTGIEQTVHELVALLVWMREHEAGAMMKTIRQLREDHGDSQHQLAEVAGVSREQVEAWEQGLTRPSVVSLRALTEHFGVDEAEIDLDPCEPPTLGEHVLAALEPSQ